MSLKFLLKIYMEEKGKATRDELRAYGKNINYDLATVDRKVRALTEKGIIEPIKGSKNFNCAYQFIGQNSSVKPRGYNIPRKPIKTHHAPKIALRSEDNKAFKEAKLDIEANPDKFPVSMSGLIRNIEYNFDQKKRQSFLKTFWHNYNLFKEKDKQETLL